MLKNGKEPVVTLEQALAALRAEYTEAPPPQLAHDLIAEFRARKRPQRVPIWVWGSAFAAIAASLLILAVRLLTPQHPAPMPVALQRVPNSMVASQHAPEAAKSVRVSSPAALPRRRSVAHTAHKQPLPVALRDAAYSDAFIPVPYSEPLAASEQIDVYRVELPRVVFLRFGIATDPGAFDDKVMADLAVGSDGVARAVRFVR